MNFHNVRTPGQPAPRSRHRAWPWPQDSPEPCNSSSLPSVTNLPTSTPQIWPCACYWTFYKWNYVICTFLVSGNLLFVRFFHTLVYYCSLFSLIAIWVSIVWMYRNSLICSYHRNVGRTVQSWHWLAGVRSHSAGQGQSPPQGPPDFRQQSQALGVPGPLHFWPASYNLGSSC